LALALSTNSLSYRVVKYFSLAMSLEEEDQSAAISVNRGELAVVIWLSPQTTFPGDRSPLSASDGLRIYDGSAASKLFSQGVSVYPSVHSDFLSKAGNLDIGIDERCNAAEQSALVPRLTNRMVIVKERMPFVFTAPDGKEPINDVDAARRYDVGEDDFDSNHILAFVVVVSAE
jgi:hypothetical protein